MRVTTLSNAPATAEKVHCRPWSSWRSHRTASGIPCLEPPPHMQQHSVMVGTLHRRLEADCDAASCPSCACWLLHAGQAGSLTQPTLSMPKPCMQMPARTPAVPHNAQQHVLSQARPALRSHPCLQVQQHCQSFGMRATLADPALLRALVDVESCPPTPVQQGNTTVGQVGLNAETPELQWLGFPHSRHQRLALRSPHLHLDPAASLPEQLVSPWVRAWLCTHAAVPCISWCCLSCL